MAAGTGRFRGLMVAGMILPLRCAMGGNPSDPAAQYQLLCAQCHGPDGAAKGPSGSRLPGRPFLDRRRFVREREEEMVRVILEGKGAMPSHKRRLTQEEVRRLLAEVVKPMAAASRRTRAVTP